MSHIFDALQRSEAEYAGGDISELPEVTEMLRRAERRAASRWETAVLSGHLGTVTDTGPGAPSDIREPRQIRSDSEAPITEEPLQAEERLAPFDQFQSLQVSITPQSRLVSLTDNGSPASEAFRLLGVRLRHLRRDRAVKKVLITSTIPQEGKSTVTANLACTLALKTQQRLLILEGDLRRPSLSKMFGIGKNPGLSEWLQDSRSLTSSIYRLESANLWLLPAGSTPSNALELLQSGKLSRLMDQLAMWFDWIIIDSPPVLPLADTSVWMRFADGILLTTRQGTTEGQQLQKGLEAIEADKLIGAVVNSSRNASTSDYYYSPATLHSS